MPDGFDALEREWRQTFDLLLGAHDEGEIAALDRDLAEITAQLVALPVGSLGQVRRTLDALIALAPIRCGEEGEFPWPELRRLAASLSQAD